MNPEIPTDPDETARWLLGFATVHAKRVDPRVEVTLDGAAGPSYRLGLRLGARTAPPTGSPPIELTYAEVVEGRPRFAWCEALAERVRGQARALLDQRSTA
ncbi:MAG TPA: hypothetical protein VLD61_06635 [Methylomirabilota bacterium]|nr:hypothetical protein [Methylomirabilota bacterium]